MGIHESKSSSSSSSSSSSASSSFRSSMEQRRRRGSRCRSNYTLITSSNNNINNNNSRHVGVSVAGAAMDEETDGGEGKMKKEDLAVCLASISLMALTGEDARLPKPGFGSSFSPAASVVAAAAASDTRSSSSFRNPFGRKKSSASWSRSSSTSTSTAAAAAAAAADSSVESVSSAAPSIKTVKTKLCEKLKRHKHQQHQQPYQQHQHQQQLPHPSHRSLMQDDRFLAEHFNSHIQLLDCLEQEDDDSSDWAAMRSWLVWCLQNKLGDIESMSNTEASDEDDDEDEEEEEERYPSSTASSSFRITSNAISSSSSSSRGQIRGVRHHQHQLRRQLALDDERPIRSGVLSSRVLCRQETSFDGATVCSPQSSFESYGSTGTGGGT